MTQTITCRERCLSFQIIFKSKCCEFNMYNILPFFLSSVYVSTLYDFTHRLKIHTKQH